MGSGFLTSEPSAKPNKFKFCTNLHSIVFSNIVLREVLQAHRRNSDSVCDGRSFTLGRPSEPPVKIKNKGEIAGFGHKFVETPGDSEEQGSLVWAAHGVAKSQTWLSDWTTVSDRANTVKGERVRGKRQEYWSLREGRWNTLEEWKEKISRSITWGCHIKSFCTVKLYVALKITQHLNTLWFSVTLGGLLSRLKTSELRKINGRQEKVRKALVSHGKQWPKAYGPS